MEYEGIEQEILLEPENAIVGAVYSVNGKTGDVVLTTSDLENDSDYQTGDEVDAAITTAIAGKQDTLTAGNNIQISAENVISATDTTYSAGNGLNLSSENAFSVDTTVVATQQNLATEVQNRENADNALQAQIDGISASSDVVDIVGTYADLQNYDTSKLKDNDIIKVLQDSTQNNATTYYRWSTSTDSFTLIGQEGPYYTKAAADAQFVPQTRTVNGKALSTNITLNASDVSALGTSDVVQTTGTSTSQVMSQNATTQALGTKLNITDYVVDDELKNSTNPVQNGVLYGLLGNMPTDFFSGNATTEQTGTEAQFTNALKISDIELQGDTFQQTYSGKNLLRAVASASTTTGGVTFTVNADGTITANGTAATGINFYPAGDANYYSIPAGTYTLSDGLTNPTSTTYFTYIDGGTTYWWNTSDGRVTQNAPEGATIRPRIVIREGQTLNNVVFKLQLESGSTATSFEPYVGGTASPNPDYPQAVQVVTGTQTVNIHGKNLLALDNFSGSFGSSQYTEFGNILDIRARYGIAASLDVTLNTFKYTKTSQYDSNQYWNFKGLQPNTNYTISCNYSITTSSATNVSLFGAYRDVSGNSLTQTFTTDGNGEKEFINQFFGAAQNDVVELTNLMVEQGSTGTPYEPYASTDYTVALGSIELAKIGTYQDYIYKSGDDWYVHKSLGKITLDGTETWTWNQYNVANPRYARTTDYTLPAQVAANVRCTHFIPINSSDSIVLAENSIRISANQIDFDFTIATQPADLAGVLSWLSSNQPVVYYVLATATDTQITDSTLIGQLNALYNAKMLAGQTNFAVSAVSPNLPAILDITVFNANAQGIIANIRG